MMKSLKIGLPLTAMVLALALIGEAQVGLWQSTGSGLTTGGTVAITSSNASALDVTGGINAGSGNVGIVGTDGRIPALSSTYIASLSGANITGIPHLADTNYTYTGSSLTIGPNTSDASDTKVTSILGGGAAAQNRGAFIQLFGNDHAFTGALSIAAGDAGSIGLFGTVNTTGRISSATAQPGFLAYLSTDMASLSAPYTVTFDTESFDNASNFASNTFTAPVTGQYHFCASVENIGTGFSAHLVTTPLTFEIKRGADSHNSGGRCEYVALSASNTAFVRIATDGGTSTIQGGTSPVITRFSGRLVP